MAEDLKTKEDTAIGIDVSKDSLEAYVWPLGESLTAENSPSGFSKLVGWAKGFSPHVIVVEPTGGYEAPLVLALSDKGLPVALVQPKQIRDFARARKVLAKTDKMDSKVLADFGFTMRPEVRPLPPEKYSLLAQLVDRRMQLSEMRTAETNRLAMVRGEVRDRIKKHLKWLEKELQVVEYQLGKEVESSPLWVEKSSLLKGVPGVGPVLIVTLLAKLPELGSLSSKAIAALVGVAPYSRESGKWRGKQTIYGGRAQVRKVLYMAALSGIRHNPALRVFYERLKKANKPFKVALTACMRKMLVILNAMVKNQTPWVAPL